jgi:hypothetical protein
MLDPRIYRTGLLAVAIAVVVVAFSLRDQQRPLSSSLAPDAFNGQNAYAMTGKLAADYPNRQPGSNGDYALGAQVAQTFRRYGFAVEDNTATVRTARGKRPLETIMGVRAGVGGASTGLTPGPGAASGSTIGEGAIVIVAHRDALTSPASAEISGTATLLELARVLAGETHHRTIVLASTSGSAGAAGATALARQLGEGVDAVIALGDLGAGRVDGPVVVPWSDGSNLAPAVLRGTVAQSLASQATLPPGSMGIGAQLAHLAVPLTLGEQGPFGAQGVPAALLSASSERPAPPSESVSETQITALGRSLLGVINALDAGPQLPRARPYLLVQGKLVPGWAVRLLGLVLLLPVIAVAVDGLARASRRGHPVLSWMLWSGIAAVPFLLVFALCVVARLTGLATTATPQPLGAAAVPIHTAQAGLLLGLVAVLVVASLAVRALRGVIVAAWRRGQDSDAEVLSAGGVSLLVLMCCATVALWAFNPFAALLAIPALHLWIWALDAELELRGVFKLALLTLGFAAPILLIVYYATTFGLSPIDLVWNFVLLLSGGHVGVVAAVIVSVLLGCATGTIALALRSSRLHRAESEAVTIRGPVTYAGPGSLGGTESALRR